MEDNANNKKLLEHVESAKALIFFILCLLSQLERVSSIYHMSTNRWSPGWRKYLICWSIWTEETSFSILLVLEEQIGHFSLLFEVLGRRRRD